MIIFHSVDINQPIDNEQLIEQCQRLQHEAERYMCRMVGMDLQRGFSSAEDFYIRIGQYDYVATCTFKAGSQAYERYGEFITFTPLYTRKQRNTLIENIKNGVQGTSNDVVCGDELLHELTDEQRALLAKEGFKAGDIESVIFFPHHEACNLYTSEEQRHLHTLNIELPQPDDKKGWVRTWFGYLNRRILDGDILTPQEHIEYIALKILYGAKDYLAPEEIAEAFFDENTLNEDYGRTLLEFKQQVGIVKERETELLRKANQNRFYNRLAYVDAQLKESGNCLEELVNSNPQGAALLFMKAFHFRELRLNGIGKYPIFLNFERFVHIYLRHVSDLGITDQMQKDAFQLAEQDVMSMIRHIIDKVNDDYQTFRFAKPNVKFSKYGSQEVYCNGDYYTLHIAPNGLLETVHKSTR